MEKWLQYSLVALIFICMIDISKKYVLSRNKIDSDTLVIVSTIVVGIFGIIHYCCSPKNNIKFHNDYKTIICIFMISIFIYAFSICFTRAMKLSTDVTMPVIVISLSTIFTYFISICFLKHTKFNYKILIGILFIVCGICIISIYH